MKRFFLCLALIGGMASSYAATPAKSAAPAKVQSVVVTLPNGEKTTSDKLFAFIQQQDNTIQQQRQVIQQLQNMVNQWQANCQKLIDLLTDLKPGTPVPNALKPDAPKAEPPTEKK